MGLTHTGSETAALLERLLAHENSDPSQMDRLVGLTMRDRLSRSLLGLKGHQGRMHIRRRWEVFRQTFPMWFKRVVSVAGLPVEVGLSSGQFWLIYMPLAEYLIGRAGRRNGRLVAGVTGAPGCGKSTLSAILAAMVDEKAGSTGIQATVCPMDGFHYTNEYLARTQVKLPDGREVSMMARKGAPETFDAGAAVTKVRQLHDGNMEVRFPEYNRIKHGPVKDAIIVPSGKQIVIVEGNYLLSREAGWQGMSELLDLVVFIDGDREAEHSVLVTRHLAGGKSRDEALRHVREVDLRNAALIRRERLRAGIVLVMSPEHVIEKVTLTKQLHSRAG